MDNEGYILAVAEEVEGCFTREQLDLVREIDSRGNAWSLKQQLMDRYYSMHPSFASMQEVRDHIKNKVGQYGPLLNRDTAAAAKEMMMDELEREVFVSEKGHLWNREMKDNLSGCGNAKIDGGVVWAIEQILKSVNSSCADKLSLEEGGVIYDLRTQLMARWQNALLASGRRHFRSRLLFLLVTGPYGAHHWESREISRVDLQALLSTMDLMFLYPGKYRRIRAAALRDDSGQYVGWKSHLRTVVSCTRPDCLFIFAVVLLMLVGCLVLVHAAVKFLA